MAEPNNIETLLIDIKESLERDMALLNNRFDAFDARFDNQTTRLERHAGLLQTGNRWVSRMNRWAEKVDTALAQKDRQILDLTKRLEELEDPKP